MAVPRRIEDVLRELVEEVHAVDTADTCAALIVAWRGFSVANAAGQLLAESDPGFAAFSNLMQPLFARIGEALRAAPAMPADPEPVMVNVACPTGDRFEERRARVIRDGIRDMALALNALLPATALHTRNETDHEACREGTRVSHELAKLL